jgi:hypothetical protein
MQTFGSIAPAFLEATGVEQQATQPVTAGHLHQARVVHLRSPIRSEQHSGRASDSTVSC